MAEFEHVSSDEMLRRTTRQCKTASLKAKLLSMKAGDIIFVAYHDAESGEGYRPSTLSQLVGKLNKEDVSSSYSTRRDCTRPGCFIAKVERA
jgi:hypothetical protein